MPETMLEEEDSPDLGDTAQLVEWLRKKSTPVVVTTLNALMDIKVRAAVAAGTEWCAKEAEKIHGFGPSTRCPDCGSEGQVLHWYTVGRKDAAAAIRARNPT